MQNPLNQRIQSIDIVRGFIMLLMLLEHIRGTFSRTAFNPMDPSLSPPEVFLTRWISHFAMPLFIFLCGISIYLTAQKKSLNPKDLAFLLFTRGLVVLAVDVIFLSPAFFIYKTKVFHFFFFFLQAMWAIGLSMILLALFQLIKSKALFIISITGILLHHLLPPLSFPDAPFSALLWNILHQPGMVIFHKNLSVYVLYPILPLFFLMTLGYSLGKIFELPPLCRKKILISSGLALTALFFLLRYFTHWGDPVLWQHYPSVLKTVLSFINLEKYPPSLLYVLMTLGPGLIALGLLEKVCLKEKNPILIFGRTAMFYYILHYSLIIITAIIIALIQHKMNLNTALKNIPLYFGLQYTYLLFGLYLPPLYYCCTKYYHYKFTKRKPWTAYF